MLCASCGQPLEVDETRLPICPSCDAAASPETGTITRIRPRLSAKFVEGDPPIGTMWLWIYTYIRLPLGVVSILLQISLLTPFYKIYAVLTIFVVLVVAVGLHRRALWGWQFNWLLLTIEGTIMVTHSGPSVGVSALGVVIAALWVAPNAVYFLRRRFLFGNTDPNHVLPAAAERRGEP